LLRLAGRYISLPAAERRLIRESLVSLWVARLRLWLAPFPSCWSLPVRVGARRTGNVEAIAASVNRAARLTPAATCLVRAMAGSKVLARHGIPSVIRVGVVKSAQGEFEAHAWLEAEQKTVIGAVDGSFAVLLSRETGTDA